LKYANIVNSEFVLTGKCQRNNSIACCKLSLNDGGCIALIGVPGLAITGFQRSACRSERILYACHTTISHSACNQTDWLIEPTASANNGH